MKGKEMTETMSLVDALTASAYRAAEAHDSRHTLKVCENGRTGRYELSKTSGWTSVTHEFATLDALLEYLETTNRFETLITSAGGWMPLLAQQTLTGN
jgi:hypothetical protein